MTDMPDHQDFVDDVSRGLQESGATLYLAVVDAMVY